MKTTQITPSDIKKEWYIVDATDKTLGRLASQIAYVLRGKQKPSFVPHLDCGDFVVVVNAEKIRVTGNKEHDKSYYHHTGYVGGIKGATLSEVRQKTPGRLIEIAVKGMMPKSALSKKAVDKLKVYAGPNHPHMAQSPKPLVERLVVAAK